MKTVVTFGPSISLRAFVVDGRLGVTPPVEFVPHEFRIERDCLVHAIDGVDRAVIEPKDARSYCEYWPDAKPVVDELLSADHGTPAAELAPVVEVKKDTSTPGE